MKRSPKRTLALIAHDGKKTEMIAFVKKNLSFFDSFHLVATATTGKLLQKEGLKVKKVLSGPFGGDAQIAAMVATEKCHAVIFMRDPLGCILTNPIFIPCLGFAMSTMFHSPPILLPHF